MVKIKMKSNITMFGGDRIHFEDSTIEEIGTIIYYTGYKIYFPFFKSDFI